MLRAGVAGLAEGAHDAAHPAPITLAVTVLTSEPRRRRLAANGSSRRTPRAATVSCARGHEAHACRAPSDLATMVPGIRLPGSDTNDQARVATRATAIRAGADWIVVGRAVTARRRSRAAAATRSCRGRALR